MTGLPFLCLTQEDVKKGGKLFAQPKLSQIPQYLFCCQSGKVIFYCSQSINSMQKIPSPCCSLLGWQASVVFANLFLLSPKDSCGFCPRGRAITHEKCISHPVLSLHLDLVMTAQNDSKKQGIPFWLLALVRGRVVASLYMKRGMWQHFHPSVTCFHQTASCLGPLAQ